MNYKSAPQEQTFLTREDISEGKKTVFFDFNDPMVKNDINGTFDYIINDWMGFIFNLPITTPIFLDLVQNGKLHSYKATPEKLEIIMKCLRSRNFDEIISENPLYSDTPMTIEGLVKVSGFGIRVYPLDKIYAKNQRAGSFFNYVAKEDLPQCLLEKLKRYQIFTSLVNEKGKRREELEDCCFVHALKYSHQFSDKVLNQIRLKIQNRYLPLKCIEELCKEFKIHMILHYITEDRNRQISTNNKKYFGVDANDASYNIEMNLFQKHYFIEEPTPISCYYIKHFENEEEQNSSKEFDIHNNCYRKARAFCRSSELIKLLFEKEYFKPITYGHYMILNTEFHKFQDSDSFDYDLHYDTKYCTKLIEENNKKNQKNNKIFFADFESDVSGDTHRPFLCVLQNYEGTINKIFREGSCGKDLLEYLPHKSTTYFHNLAYDIRMFAHYGIFK